MLEELKEDIEQYQLALEDFENMMSNDGDTAIELSKVFLRIADRWNEIQLNSKKYSSMMGIAKTQFNDYAYHKYSLAKEMHITCRSVWRNAKEDIRNTFYGDE